MSLTELEAAGVLFSVPALSGGFFQLGADEAQEFVADPIEWYARAYDVDRDRIEAWQAFNEAQDLQCRAATQRGSRCKGIVEFYYGTDRVFDPARDLYCRQHQTVPSKNGGHSLIGGETVPCRA